MSPPSKNPSNSDKISVSSTLSNDYDNERFEEDTQEDNCSSSEISLSTLERLEEAHQPKTLYNKTFTSAQVREIERQNAILMNKILSYSRKPNKPIINSSNKYQITSAAINRKKNQQKIDWENQILLKKIQAVKPAVRYNK